MKFTDIIDWEIFDHVDRFPDGRHRFDFGTHLFQIKPYMLGINNHLTPNFHDYFEIIYCIRGAGWYEIESQQDELKPGKIIYIGPNDMHTFWSEPDNPVYLIALYFKRDFICGEASADFNEFYLLPFLAYNRNRDVKTGTPEHSGIVDLIERLLKLNSDTNAQHYQKPLLMQILLLIRDQLEIRETGWNYKASPLTRLGTVFRFLEENSASDLTIQEIADTACMSKYHFCRTFKAVTGATCTEYLNRIRIDKAKVRLRETDHAVSFIAHETGFRNLSYFNSRFRTFTGMTPLSYRRRIREIAGP